LKLTREIKTAFLVIVGIAVFIFGYSYLKGLSILDSYNTFYTEFDYNALKQASPVTIKGNQVGKITTIKYDFKTGKTRVAFTVIGELEFSKNSKVRMYDLGLMEGKGLAIIPANDGATPAKNGDILQSEVEEGLINTLTSNFSGLSTGLDSTLKKADTLLTNLNVILKDESDKGLKHAVMELNLTLQSFQKLSASANNLVVKNTDSLSALISNFNQVSQDLAGLSTDLKDIKLSETVANLDSALNNVNTLLDGINKGEGTLGLLMTDDKLYHNLEVATFQLKELLQDFKLNPKRYIHVSVFGKKAEEFEKPEDERE